MPYSVLLGRPLQHLIHHRPGGFWPSLALLGGGWCDVHPRLCWLHRSAAWKLFPAQICMFPPWIFCKEEQFFACSQLGGLITILVKFRVLWISLFQFSVFLGIIFFLELTAGVLAFVFKDWIKDQLNFFINNNIRAYRDDIDLQNLIDFTQEYVSTSTVLISPHCCFYLGLVMVVHLCGLLLTYARSFVTISPCSGSVAELLELMTGIWISTSTALILTRVVRNVAYLFPAVPKTQRYVLPRIHHSHIFLILQSVHSHLW